MGWTSLNLAKSWVLKHPTHQRWCVPANFLAFSLRLCIFLCWLQCCMVNKIQKLVCWFKRHKYKWKYIHLKTSHPWVCVRMGHPKAVQAIASKPRLEATCVRESSVTFLLKFILMKFQDLPAYVVLLILSSLSTVLQHLTFLVPHLASTSSPHVSCCLSQLPETCCLSLFCFGFFSSP